MIRNYFLLCLFGISVCFLTGVVSLESIVGGALVQFTECRYQATILIPHQPPTCGGSILKDQFVLTAAHCVIGGRGLLSRAISVLVATINLEAAGIVIGVETVYVPYTYHFTHVNRVSDIAVLKLSRTLAHEVDRELVTNVRLPKNLRLSYTDQRAMIAGFGWDQIYPNNEGIGDHSDNNLRYANAMVLSHDQCRHEHPNLNILDEHHLCARATPIRHAPNRRHGTCVGDDGGALVINGKIAIGVLTITTHGCSERNVSAVYTKVSKYRRFIHNAMNNTVTVHMYKYNL